MAKDNRIIHSGIRVGNDVYLSDQEDELAAVLSPKDGERLIEAGALEGDWQFTSVEVKPDSEDEAEPAKAKAPAKAKVATPLLNDLPAV